MPVTSYSRSCSRSSGHPARRRARSIISLRVALSFQSRVSGTVSFSALTAASRSRSASSSPATSLHAFFGCVPIALQGVQFLDAGRRGVWFECGDQRLVEGLPVKALRPFPQIGAARPVEDVRQLPHHVQRLLRRSGVLLPCTATLPACRIYSAFCHTTSGTSARKAAFAEVGVQVRHLRRVQGLCRPCRHA